MVPPFRLMCDDKNDKWFRYGFIVSCMRNSNSSYFFDFFSSFCYCCCSSTFFLCFYAWIQSGKRIDEMCKSAEKIDKDRENVRVRRKGHQNRKTKWPFFYYVKGQFFCFGSFIHLPVVFVSIFWYLSLSSSMLLLIFLLSLKNRNLFVFIVSLLLFLSFHS